MKEKKRKGKYYMKINIKQSTYNAVMAKKRPKHRKPLRPLFLLQIVVRVLAILDLWPTKFTYRTHGMEKIGKREPCLILMNHSSFIDLKIASKIFFPKRYGIVCTTDAFVGFCMSILMRLLGCIPTRKFVTDMTLINDMAYLLKKKKTSVLMFPEAGYSFDGTTTTLPRKMGVLLKKLGVPVVTVITQGAFARQPLYNNLKLRKVVTSADVRCLATAEEVKSMTVARLDALIDQAFGFDNFRYQQENKQKIDEAFRAEGLNRILYKCPHCGAEGKTEGKGTMLTCHSCGKAYELTEYGYLEATDGASAFTHVPHWYAWQRQEVKKELEDGTYRLDVPVEIGMIVDYSALYMVGTGRLTHTTEGFTLTSDDGQIHFTQPPLASHTLNADYYWYEIGDMIGVGNSDVQFYCFPQNCGDIVTKTRLAVEELYKLKKSKKAPL